MGLVCAKSGAASALLTDYHDVVLATARKNAVTNGIADRVAVCRYGVDLIW